MAQQTKSKANRSSNGSRTRARNSRSRNGTSMKGTTTKSRSRTGHSSNGSQSRATRRTASSTRGTRRSPSKKTASSTRGTRSSPSKKTSSQKSTVETAKDATVNGAKAAGGAVASAAKQFKTPAIAAGVGFAGVAGGIALRRGTKSKKSPLSGPLSRRRAKATSKKISGAAKNVGAVAEQTGQVAERVRQLSVVISGEGSAAGRSPVEVVLDGLTKRGGAAPRT
jgi:hypothetical protein